MKTDMMNALSAPPHLDKQHNRQKPQVLIVDDDNELREILGLFADYEGYEVVLAATGEEALAAIENETPDLVLLDLVMPGMSGYDVLLRVKELYPHLDLPIVVVTAREETRDHVEALQSGAVDYIEKPVNFTILGARMFAHISRKLAKEELAAANEHLEELVQEKTHELEIEQEYLSAVLDNAQDGIIACDDNGLPVLFNKSASEMLGIENSLSLLMPLITSHRLFKADGVTPLDMGNSPLTRAFNDNHKNQSEIVVDRYGDTPHIVSTHGRSILDQQGKKIGAVISLHDVTDHRTAERQASHNAAQIDELIQKMPLPAIVINEQGEILQANHQISSTLEKDPEDLVDQKLSSLLTTQSRHLGSEPVRTGWFVKGFVNATECQLQQETGERVTTMLSGYVQSDENGENCRMILFFSPQTD
ncbi:PAS fold [Cohaesibacter sp. ES.047]|uniref:response regulator n=1 Tax=Cohaesibacter sp. ES.047 TaxID=1798205 RepID=UPI000BB7D5F1|nr:response regulator [Cohaesibacter sp. ES.047]SNY91330.1 PAS fold [Cohaesibacter sp. ES.047]